MITKFTRSLFTVAVCILLVGAFTGAAFAEEPQEGGTLTYGLPLDPINLDPAQMSHMEAHRFVNLLYPTLFQYRRDLSLRNDLIEEYEIIDDTTYEFKLNEGIKFHNGREMVAEDVKYSVDRLLDPEVPSPEAFELEPVERIEVIDDYTFRVIMEDTFSPILHGFAFGIGIHPEEAVEEFGDLTTDAMGAGPFRLTEYSPKEIITLEKFEDFYGEGPYIDEVEFVFMEDATARRSALQAGDIDVTRFEDPLDVQPLRADPDITVDATAQPSMIHFHLNNRREPFDDWRVRLAMSYALNREEISEAILDGDGEPTGPVLPAMGEWAIDTKHFRGYDHDPEKALQLLEEAGYPDGFETSLMTTENFPIQVRMAEVMVEQLDQVGIDVTLEIREWGDMLDMWIEHHDFDTLIIGSSTGRDPDANFYRRFLSTSGRNAVGYENKATDLLMQAGRETVDPEERFEIYRELQYMLTRDNPKVFVLQMPLYFAYRDNVKNWETHPMEMYRENLTQVWLEE